MAINYIPGPESILAPAVREIGMALDKFINPHKDFQLGMQKVLSANPELMLQLADVEKETPGTMERLGFGGIGQIIQSLPGTVEGEAMRGGGRADAVRGRQLQVKNIASQNELVAKALDKATGELAKNSEYSQEYWMNLIGIVSPDERRTRKAQATVAEAKASVATEEAAADRAKAQEVTRASAAQQAAIERIGDVSQINVRQLAKDFYDQKIDTRLVSDLFIHPELREAWITNLDEVGRERARAGQIQLAQTRTSTDRALDRQENAQAFNMYRASNAGNAELWRKYLYDSATQDRAVELQNNPSLATTPEDKKLLEIVTWSQAEFSTEHNKKILDLRTAINSQFKILQEATGESRNAEMASLNQLLEQRAALGGPKLKVRFRERWGPMRGVFEFLDENGNVYNEEEAGAIVGDITNGTPVLSDKELAIVDRILQFDDPSAAYQAYASDAIKGKEDPAIRENILRWLEAKGHFKRGGR